MTRPCEKGAAGAAQPTLLSSPLGNHRLLARPGDRRLHLLDPRAAVLWDLHAGGLPAAALAGLLSERFGLAAADARIQVDHLFAAWREAGLLESSALPAPLRLDRPDDPVWPPPRPAPVPGDTACIALADRSVSLGCDDTVLQDRLDRLLAGAYAAAPAPFSDHHLQVQGTATAWRLILDGSSLAHGSGADAALVAVMSALTELGCRPTERLLVLHGAGLVAPDGRGLLLVAPGGAGKSTLTAALDAVGYALLSDDVVPVTLRGELLRLGLPLCLKPGSWPVLAVRRPELGQTVGVQRFGLPVRYLPPHTPAPTGPVRAGLLLFPRYRAGAAPRWEPVTPERALQGIIEAEAVLRALTQSKLDALARWVSQVPAYSISYSDLDAAIALVTALLHRDAGGVPG